MLFPENIRGGGVYHKYRTDLIFSGEYSHISDCHCGCSDTDAVYVSYPDRAGDPGDVSESEGI